MATSPALLEPYIARICREDFNAGNNPSPIFPPSQGNDRPTLKPDCSNLILLFLGCFNPPHIGHARVLTHSFENTGPDWNVIAAIVCPTAKRHLVKKCAEKNETNPVILTYQQRVTLLKNHFQNLPWCWVPEDANYWRDDVLDRLIADTAEDGFKIEFVSLGGSEGFCPISQSSRQDCDKMIISDAGREAEYWKSSSNRPEWFSGWSKWEQIEVNPMRLAIEIKEIIEEPPHTNVSKRKRESQPEQNDEPEEDKAAGYYTDNPFEPPETSCFGHAEGSEQTSVGEFSDCTAFAARFRSELAQRCNIYECKRGDLAIRFIRSQHGDKSCSSTKIRGLLEATQTDPMNAWAKLERIALSPHLLRQMV